MEDFVAPEVEWKGDLPVVPEGFKEVVEGSKDAGLWFAKTGVRPTHFDCCKYVLWVKEGAPEFGEGELVRIAREWIEKVGEGLARAIAYKDYQYGKRKIVKEIEELTGMEFPFRKVRARDVSAFLEAVRWVLEKE